MTADTPTGRNVPRRALVTGASAGIGKAFAEALAADRYDLVLVARNRERLEELARTLEHTHAVSVEVDPADLTEAAALGKIEARIAADPQLDLVINNAGFGTVGPFAELDADGEEQEIRLNVVALVRLTRAALPQMIARKSGSIINVSSLAAMQPGPANATYAATKAYVNSFTEALHEELRGTGVYVQALCPGFTHTEFQDRAGVDKNEVPAIAWMSAEAVVEASLAAMRRRQLICIPGVLNRLMATLVGLSPRALVRWVVGRGATRLVKDGPRGSGNVSG